MRESRAIELNNTNFIFDRNLAGIPEKNGKFRSSQRNCTILIPDLGLATEMEAMGMKVGYTKPKEGEEEGFIPKAFIKCIANYETAKQPPLIYMVFGDGQPVLMDAASVAEIDFAYVTNVRVAINPWPNQNGGLSAYIQVMYVECEQIDPYRGLYANR